MISTQILILSSIIATIMGTHHAENKGKDGISYDITHHLIDDLDINPWLVDLLTTVPFIYMMIFHFQIVPRFLRLYAFVMIIRSFTISCTVHPVAIKKKRIWNNRPHHDLNFSGHTCFIILSILCICSHGNSNATFWVMYALMVLICIISNRQHYTSDVLTALYISLSTHLLHSYKLFI